MNVDHDDHYHKLDVSDIAIDEMEENPDQFLGDAHRASDHYKKNDDYDDDDVNEDDDDLNL